MKKNLPWLLLALALAVQAAPAPNAAAPELKPLQQQPRAAHLSAELLAHYHYGPVVLDDDLSSKIFDRYLKILDPERVFFVQADIDRWSAIRTQLDDAILKEDLSQPFGLFNAYAKRVVERYTQARALLKKGFDFSLQESYAFQREKAPWAASDQEIEEIWRKRVKSDWLRLKLTGKEDKAIAETLDKRYENFIKRIRQGKSEDAFQVFMNAYTLAVDPHTNYMGPRAAEDFDISMRLSLVGIGAVLEDKDDCATVKELVAGGPASLSGRIKVGDRIVGVAQGEKGAMTDVMGWRLDDTVALIRGAADSVVRLDILPADAGPEAPHKNIVLIRKKITLEEQAAKKSIQTVQAEDGEHRIGVISLPGFYQDFEAKQRGDKDFKSATRDVARLLAELKQDKVESVLIDLRNNGGGSLTEAIELTGLFIGTGPVVMQKDAQGRISVGRDDNPSIAWNGPLGVLINRGSASASEIFAAAIQDYRRGIILGETSFGKGTVQTLVNLDEASRSNGLKLGDLKLTIAQFFRINGGTTQLRGVTPDLALPSFSDPEHFGESSYDNALPWTRLRTLSYDAVADLSDVLPLLQVRHDARIDQDKEFIGLREDIADLQALRQKNEISLNEAVRRQEQAIQEAKRKQRHPEDAKAVAGKDKEATKEGKEGKEEAADLSLDEGAEADAKVDKASKDLLLTEAARILGDELAVLKSRPGLAARALPDPRQSLRQ